MAQLEKLLAADPGDAFVLYGLAQEHAKLGNHAGATAYYDRCIAADPGYCYAYYHKARSLEALGRLGDAKEVLLAGMAAARARGDDKAIGEMGALLESL